jgi:hypothetical protein
VEKQDIYHYKTKIKDYNDKRYKPSFDFTAHKKETKTFLDALAKKTAYKITITFLKYPEKKEDKPNVYILNDRRPFKVEEAYDILEKEDAWRKNAVYGYSVLWAFSRENQYFNIALIDDIENIEAFKLRDHFLLWNTSNKYQAAFLLDKGVTAEEIKKIQKMLIRAYGGDPGGIGASHTKKMPGFYNTKYKDNPPYMKLEYIGTRVIDTKHALQKYEEIYGKSGISQGKEKSQAPLTAQQSLSQLSSSNIQKTWQDFMRERGNRSQADIAYAIYLTGRGYTEEQVRQALLSESEDIEIRKKGHLDDYLDRTLIAAKRYFETHHKERKTW